jgi:hypothetical protein
LAASDASFTRLLFAGAGDEEELEEEELPIEEPPVTDGAPADARETAEELPEAGELPEAEQVETPGQQAAGTAGAAGGVEGENVVSDVMKTEHEKRFRARPEAALGVGKTVGADGKGGGEEESKQGRGGAATRRPKPAPIEFPRALPKK